MLNVLSRSGIWIAVPLFALSAGLRMFLITGLVRLGSASQIASLPLLEQQAVAFSEAGRVVLSLEGPRLSKRFSELAFDLFSPDGRTSLSGRTTWFHARSAGMSTVRMELLSFTPGVPGQYLLRIKGLGARSDEDGRHQVVFSRPYLPQSIGFILGIILSAGILIGSTVLFVLRLVSRGGSL